MENFIMLRALSLAGLVLSIYAARVKRNLRASAQYHPVCDIRANISCTKALGSRYSTTMGVQNPVLGILYYITILALTFYKPGLILFPATAAVLFSLYLAFISYVVQRNFCLVCSATYLVNIAILTAAVLV